MKTEMDIRPRALADRGVAPGDCGCGDDDGQSCLRRPVHSTTRTAARFAASALLCSHELVSDTSGQSTGHRHGAVDMMAPRVSTAPEGTPL